MLSKKTWDREVKFGLDWISENRLLLGRNHTKDKPNIISFYKCHQLFKVVGDGLREHLWSEHSNY